MSRVDPRHLAHPKFYTKSGWLTPYALACGYIEEKHYGPIWITLYRDGVYHVRAYDHEKKVRRIWETFRTLTEARRYYRHAEALLVSGHEAICQFSGEGT